MLNKSTKGLIILLMILLILLVVFGCGGGNKGKENDRKDRAKKETLQRNVTLVAEEAKKSSLSICTGNAPLCASEGEYCKLFAIATNPESCVTAPKLICSCPESTACVIDRTYGIYVIEYNGHCLNSGQIDNS